MTIIEQLKAEIERLLKSQIQHFDSMGGPTNFDIATLGWVLEKISALESEKPSGPIIEEPIDCVLYAAACGIKNATGKSEKPITLNNELNEEITRYCGTREQRPVPDFIEQVARHFAQWGAEHLKK